MMELRLRHRNVNGDVGILLTQTKQFQLIQVQALPDGGRSSANAARVLGGNGRERHRWSDTLRGGSSGDTPSWRDKA